METLSEVEKKLTRALVEENILPYLQPIINLNTQTIAGFEALARWIDPIIGLVPSDSFIPLLEADGRIIQLDFSVFKQVCAMIHTYSQKGKTLKRISCNFSRSNFEKVDFSEKIKRIMKEYNVSENQIAVEVTESIQIKTTEIVEKNIQDLHDLRIPIHIDDYGKGYTSYEDFDLYKPTTFKIDKNILVETECLSSNDTLIDLIQMGQEKGLDIITEGVENKKQADFLIRQKCKYVQGFYYYPPMPAEKAIQLL